MRPDVTLALSLAMTLGVLCVGALRMVDLNEKEPLWALSLLVWLGAVAAGGAALVHHPERSALDAALLAEGAKAAAIAGGVAVIVVVGRRRGISELNSFLDCLLYGAAAGAGFAIGDGFIRATYATVTELQSPDPRGAADLLWLIVQSCLTEAAFATILGAAIGGAVLVRSRLARLAIVPAALAAAVAVHAAYASLVLEDGVHAPGVSVAGVVAVLLIVALIAAGLAHALTGEQRTIGAELAGELDTGAVTPAELHLLSHPTQRQRAYLAKLAAGDVEEWVCDRRLHNRQVSLAFAKRRARSATGDEAGRLSRVELIRAAIAEGRARAEAGRPRRRVAPFVVAGLILAAGIAVVQAASGEHAPSTFATRTSLAEREARRLDEHAQASRTLRAEIPLVPAEWTLLAAKRSDALLSAGAREAYDLRYRAKDHGTVRYAIARFASARAAKDGAERLGRPRDADAWAADKVVSQVRGPDSARSEFCWDVAGDASYERCLE